jgi:hypothetical protein
MSENEKPRNRPRSWIPLVIDIATLAGFLFLVPWLGDLISSHSSWNHLLLIPGFFLIIAGTVAIRSLPDYAIDEDKGPSVLGVCLVFILLLSYCLLYTYSTNLGGSVKSNDGVAVIIFFVLLLPVCGAFSIPISKAKADTPEALIVESIGLISVNYLTLVGAAVWDRFSSMPTGKEPVYATGISFLILYGIIVMLFLVFFGLPRVYLLRATGDKRGLLIYVAGVAVFLWDKVPAVN